MQLQSKQDTLTHDSLVEKEEDDAEGNTKQATQYLRPVEREATDFWCRACGCIYLHVIPSRSEPHVIYGSLSSTFSEEKK